MQFIVNDQRIAVENFQIGKIYTIKFATSYLTAACIGIGADFVAFQRTQPDYIFILSMETAADVVSIDLSVIVDTVSGQPPLSFISDGSNLLHWTMYGNTVQNGTPTPTAPVPVQGVGDIDSGQYIIPISSGSATTSINLGAVKSTRCIKKLVLDGTETWYASSNTGVYYTTKSVSLNPIYSLGVCNRFVYHFVNLVANLAHGEYLIDMTNKYTWFRNNDITTLQDWKTYLQQQYVAEIPVTVWYVLSNEEIGTVNEPLHKIGSYADSISDVAAIPTVSDINTLSVDTTVQPSNMIIQSQI